MEAAAIVVAIFGTVVLVLGGVALSVVTALRRKMKRILAENLESEPSEDGRRPDAANPIELVMEENQPAQWPVPVPEYAQRRWSSGPIPLQLDSRVDM